MLHINCHSRPGALNAVIVHLHNGETFEGSIDIKDLLKSKPDGFLLVMKNGEMQRFRFGTEQKQVKFVACNGQPNCDVKSFHIDKPLEPFRRAFPSSR